jgi:hypothetical protein
MGTRRVSSPRPHRTLQPTAVVSLSGEKPSLMAASAPALPTGSPDPFDQARRLWGHLLLKVHRAVIQEDC